MAYLNMNMYTHEVIKHCVNAFSDSCFVAAPSTPTYIELQNATDGSSIYRLYQPSVRVKYDDVSTFCSDDGGSIVMVKTQEKEDFIVSNLLAPHCTYVHSQGYTHAPNTVYIVSVTV
jgi:hypothetical protein